LVVQTKAFFLERFFTVFRSVCALQKRTRDVLPLAAEGRTASQQLPSCCRGRSRPAQSPPRTRAGPA
jgi:hypothetical protein